MSTKNGYHLAQINIAQLLAPLESPRIAAFVAQLDAINALADEAPGFVWRLQGEGNNATDIQIDEDPLIIVNMSLWESVDALRAYTYQSAHAAVMRRRRDWFERATTAHLALWWLPAGRLPTVGDGLERLDHLRRHGPTPYAFTFKQPFAP